MSLPLNDYFGLQKSGLLKVCYRGNVFTICHVAQWAYMAVMVLDDTTNNEYEESRISLAAWHIDCEFAQKIMENNAVFAATILSKQTTKEPDLVAIITSQSNPLEAIRNEVLSGVRQPIQDPVLDRIFKIQETERLKTFVDKYGENPQFSDKKVWVGMLMLLLYPLGLPFFYFNKPAWGGIMLGCFLTSFVLPVLLIPAGLLGCVLIVLTLFHVFGNNAKDKEGRLICTKKNQKLILDSIAAYKKNLAELEAEHGND